MDFRILGPLNVSDGGRPIRVDRPKQRALLIALLLRPGQVVSLDRLLDDLWGERPPPSARASLQNAISMLRKTLGGDVLVTRSPGYLLAVEPEQVDAVRFERLVEEARPLPPPDAAARLREALALWRGAALADVAFEPFAEVEADRLEELRAAAREDLVEAELALGRHEAVVPELERIVAEQPFRERPRAQLMLALYRSGRQADALEAYHAARRFLDDELGLEPSPALQQLQQAILRQDPALDAPAAAGRVEERRATVTVLFADLVGSTEIAARLDPEAYRDVLRRYFRTARAALERHGGMVEKFVGDAVVAVFGVPERHEDDALRAVRAAVGLRTAVSELGGELRLRIGVNTGEAVVGGDAGALATGYVVNVAAKLEQSAAADEILIGAATYRLVRDAVVAEPARETAAPVAAFRLESVSAAGPAIPRRLEAPLVGRRDELAALTDAFAVVQEQGGCRVVTVAGEAGIGKTRLARELVDAVGEDARLLVGRCVSYGEGATYLPLAETVRQLVPDGSEDGLASLLGEADDARLVAGRVRELTGLAPSAAPAQEGFWAVRRLLEAVAETRPVLLVLDDVHWAEPALLDLVAYLGERHEGAPVLVVCLARPDLREARPDWPVAVELAPLTQDESAELLANLPLGAEVAAETRARIAELAEGNALFAEQLLAHAAETGDEGLASVPLSLEALIASRLDRLPERERAVVDCAAVLGRTFDRPAVEHLYEGDAAAELGDLLGRALMRETRDRRLAFHHVLIREVAYAAITKRRRSELHERAADWLDAQEGADELVGYHLEQAYRLREALGRPDGHARRLAHDAGRRLGAAGMRAWKQGDVHATLNLLGRSTSLLPEEDAWRRELLVELGVARWAGGDAAEASELLDSTVRAAEAAHDRRIELRARLQLAAVRLFAEPDGMVDRVLEITSEAIPVLKELDDDRGLALARWLTAFVEGGFRCRYAASERHARSALEHYERAGWPSAAALRVMAAAAFYGPRHARPAIKGCEKLMAQAGRVAEAEVSTYLAGLEAMRGALPTARALLTSAREVFHEHGLSWAYATIWAPVSAYVAILADEVDGAATTLAHSCDDLEKLGRSADLSSQAALLADALYTQGRTRDADQWALRAALSASAADVHAQISWRPVRAKLLAVAGASDEAESMAREAVQLAEKTDALNLHAKALLDFAEVLRFSGESERAREHVGAALALYEAKGNHVAARGTRALLAELQPA